MIEAGFSPMLELISAAPEGMARRKLIAFASQAAEMIEANAEVAQSLKGPKVGGLSHMRQIDLRDGQGGEIIVKTFTMWNHDRQCWRVLLELPNETYFEADQVCEEQN